MKKIEQIINGIKDLEFDNENLLEACQFTLNILNELTSEQFSRGEDKPARDKLEDAISDHILYQNYSLEE